MHNGQWSQTTKTWMCHRVVVDWAELCIWYGFALLLTNINPLSPSLLGYSCDHCVELTSDSLSYQPMLHPRTCLTFGIAIWTLGMLVWQVVMPPRRLEPMTMRNVREGVSWKRDGEVWHGDTCYLNSRDEYKQYTWRYILHWMQKERVTLTVP